MTGRKPPSSTRTTSARSPRPTSPRSSWHSLLTISNDYKYYPQLAADPIPTTDNGGVKVLGQNGDAMTVTWKLRDGLKWSDGQPLTCDDFKYAWEWVIDKDNAGVVHHGLRHPDQVRVPDGHRHDLALQQDLRGLPDPHDAPLPRHYLSKIPIKDQVNGAGFRADEIAKMPVSGPVQVRVRHARGRSSAWSRTTSTQNPKDGKPANLDSVVFKWYGDPDAMIAGYRAGEIDLAFDLQDSDIPKVQDLGDQVAAVPALLYEYLRPNWSPGPFKTDGPTRTPAAARATRPSRIAAPAARWPTRRSARRSPTRSTRTRSTPGSWAATSRSPTPRSARRPGSTRTRPRRPSTRPRPSRSSTTAGWTDTDADGIVEKNGLTRQDRAVHDDPPGPPGHPRAHRALAQGRRHRQRDQPRRSERRSSPTTTRRTNDTPCSLSRSNFDLAEHAFRARRSTRSATTPATTAASSEPNGANDAQVKRPGPRRGTRRRPGQRRLRQGQGRDGAQFQKIYVDKTVEVPLYYRKQVDLASPKRRQLLRQPDPGRPTWNA